MVWAIWTCGVLLAAAWALALRLAWLDMDC